MTRITSLFAHPEIPIYNSWCYTREIICHSQHYLRKCTGWKAVNMDYAHQVPLESGGYISLHINSALKNPAWLVDKHPAHIHNIFTKSTQYSYAEKKAPDRCLATRCTQKQSFLLSEIKEFCMKLGITLRASERLGDMSRPHQDRLKDVIIQKHATFWDMDFHYWKRLSPHQINWHSSTLVLL